MLSVRLTTPLALRPKNRHRERNSRLNSLGRGQQPASTVRIACARMHAPASARIAASRRMSSAARKPDSVNQCRALETFPGANAPATDACGEAASGDRHCARKRFPEVMDAMKRSETSMLMQGRRDCMTRLRFEWPERAVRMGTRNSGDPSRTADARNPASPTLQQTGCFTRACGEARTRLTPTSS